MSHTPGPWDEEIEANQRLRAAAPDLLEACKDLVKSIKDASHYSVHQICATEDAEAAIAKAEGK